MDFIRFLRVERPRTGSWLTFELPKPIPYTGDFGRVVEVVVAELLPGWEVVSGMAGNPDQMQEAE